MSLYPEVQKKAQEELDRVVGPDRLPEFGDSDDLVYIQGIILEAMRWMVVLPLGVSHRVIADDEYMGYFIPKGTTVIPVSKILREFLGYLNTGYAAVEFVVSWTLSGPK